MPTKSQSLGNKMPQIFKFSLFRENKINNKNLIIRLELNQMDNALFQSYFSYVCRE
jgi:hypothetical protein